MRITVPASSKKRDKRRKRKRAGFTLIEITIALLIAAGWIAFVLRTVGDGIRLKRLATLQTEAVHLAKIKMAQIDSASILQKDVSSGDIPGYRGFRYSTIINEEDLDLLKLSGKGGKKPEDLLGGSNSEMNKLISQRTGNNQGSATGGLIKVFHIYVTIEYPTGERNSQGDIKKEKYTVETFKASMN
ncbi:prepilin-type cleavage/methylation N-terminal domain protein [Leptospira fainei serovar Hurstbridge str. BUT 6]|uniref:Prepilin-type cleavage/methylation N-terminal domain protein n=1 Tax=Leptospira fainei serovar Hurstbridge str. BUT 6 TaxID=1193011 RepID=S3UZM9_9LEPT|nr:type II secretion system protein [Leptospira fainei]EPG75886.1 prepilin-type cleavage/methylation N-terminal domain protein [Leptospira fainei serovar Hurstbridge str. BUT 6]